MATFSSKQEKKQGFVYPIFALASIMLISALVVFGSLSGNMYNSIRSTLGTEGSAAGNISINNDASFVSDLQYWDANCSRGWDSDSTCDNIDSRAQSCVLSTTSAYCSDYDTYIQHFRK